MHLVPNLENLIIVDLHNQYKSTRLLDVIYTTIRYLVVYTFIRYRNQIND